jgi:hypothetical protein
MGEPIMAKKDKDVLYVLAATYDEVDMAVADYEAVKELYRAVKSSNDFDASVVAKGVDGKVHIVKKHEQPTRHGAAVGLGWGLAVGWPPCCSRRSASVWPQARRVARRSAASPGT